MLQQPLNMERGGEQLADRLYLHSTKELMCLWTMEDGEHRGTTKIKNQTIKETQRLGRHGGFRSLQEQPWLLIMAQPFRITATKSTFQSLTSFCFFLINFLNLSKAEIHFFSFQFEQCWKQDAIFACPPP